MRADPVMPTVSAAAVAGLGAAAAAAHVELEGRIVGFSRVRVPLRLGTAACGLPELVHTETGDGMGVCANRELAERIMKFFR